MQSLNRYRAGPELARTMHARRLMDRPYERLPLAISLPHAGREVPGPLAELCRLDGRRLGAAADVEAEAIFWPLSDLVEAFVTTKITRVVVDANRAEDDRGTDGVVKTHTLTREPVFHRALHEVEIEGLIWRYHRPYHAALARSAARQRFGLDCHTVVAADVPAEDGASARPARAWLGNDHGRTCASESLECLAQCLTKHLGGPVVANGHNGAGYITCSQPGGIPWVELALCRGPWMSVEDKQAAVRASLTEFCKQSKLL